MSLKTATKKTGNGILNVTATIVASVLIEKNKTRINEIDKTITALQEERVRLAEELTELTGI